MKDVIHTLVVKNFLALNPKIYIISHQALSKDTAIVFVNKNVLKGVSTVVVENEIKDQDYKDALAKDKIAKREATRTRSIDHQPYTYKQNTVALTSHYDKLKMPNPIDCLPVGYAPK